MGSPFTLDRKGNKTWIHQDGDVYVATGVDTKGKRFPAIRYRYWSMMHGINLYRGSKWLERDGKRYLIQRVWN